MEPVGTAAGQAQAASLNQQNQDLAEQMTEEFFQLWMDSEFVEEYVMDGEED
ncbi:MAG: hypothetical protein AAGD04_03415 [Pseudomonadota bacterium]